jgi:hypothetical protein
MDVVILGIGLDRARRGVAEAVVVGAEAAHVQPPHIPLGMTFDDPFRHDLSNAARACQPVGTEGACHPETFD